MENFIKLFLAIFAIYRLSSLISSEEGPYFSFLYKDPEQTGIFKWLRKKAGAEEKIFVYDERGNVRVKIRTNLGRGISCPLCVGAYVTALVVALMYLDWTVTGLFLAWLGMWGVQTFLENLTSDDAIEDAIQDVADSVENGDDDDK